jgi:hypothetical protein
MRAEVVFSFPFPFLCFPSLLSFLSLSTTSYYAAQTRFELEILLPQPPKCWDYRSTPSHPTWFSFSFCTCLWICSKLLGNDLFSTCTALWSCLGSGNSFFCSERKPLDKGLWGQRYLTEKARLVQVVWNGSFFFVLGFSFSLFFCLPFPLRTALPPSLWPFPSKMTKCSFQKTCFVSFLLGPEFFSPCLQLWFLILPQLFLFLALDSVSFLFYLVSIRKVEKWSPKRLPLGS